MTVSADQRKSNCKVGECGVPTTALICRPHTARLRTMLTAIPELLAELEVTVTRQDRGTGAPLYAMSRSRVQLPGVHYDEGQTTLPSTSWPFSWDASNVRWNVLNALVTWARHIAETNDLAIDGSATAFLIDHLTDVRRDEAAGELYDEIRACHRDAVQAVDRQVPDEFLGRCDAMVMTTHEIDGTLIPELAPCGADLYIRTGDDDARCAVCGSVYDAQAKRVELDARIPDALGTPATIADAITTRDQPLDRVTLNRWIERDFKQTERTKEGPACTACEHRTCEALRAAEIQAIVKRQGRPLIYRQGWNADGKSVYRAGDVQARMAWNASVRGGRMGA